MRLFRKIFIACLSVMVFACGIPDCVWAQAPGPIRVDLSKDAERPLVNRAENSAPPPGSQIAPEPGAAHQVNLTGDYILGPGDVIDVIDYSAGPNTTTREMPILPDGTVNIFPVGVVKAAGLSLKQFNEVVNEKAEKYFVQPQLDITVKIVRPTDIYVLGAVANPGIYATHSLNGDPTGFDQTPTLVTALQRAGGLKEDADVCNIRITRLSASQPLHANLWDILVYGDTKQDMALQSGDTIYVPKGGPNYDSSALGMAAHQKRSVRVWGQVKAPGLYELKPDDDILSVIATAGGFAEYAKTRNVFLSRLNKDGTVHTEEVSIRKSLTSSKYIGRSPVQAGDVIIVSGSATKRISVALARTGLAIAAGMALILFSYNIRNINARPVQTAPSNPLGLGIL